MIEINEKKLRKELKEAQEWLDGNPTNWSRLEGVARCLHWLKVPEEMEYFRRAADSYPFTDTALDLLRKGNLYRLSGELAQSREFFLRAEELLLPSVGKYKDMALEQIAQCYILLEKYFELDELAAEIPRKVSERDGIFYYLWQLARAVITQEQSAAITTRDFFETIVRKQRWKISDTAGLTPWDWYEICSQIAIKLKTSIDINPA